VGNRISPDVSNQTLTFLLLSPKGFILKGLPLPFFWWTSGENEWRMIRTDTRLSFERLSKDKDCSKKKVKTPISGEV